MLHYMTVVSVSAQTLQRRSRIMIIAFSHTSSTADVLRSPSLCGTMLKSPYCIRLFKLWFPTELFRECSFFTAKVYNVVLNVYSVTFSTEFCFYFFNASLSHWCLSFFLRMTCFLWRWGVSCITSVSRELSKCSDSTTMSPTACVVGRVMRCIHFNITWVISSRFYIAQLCVIILHLHFSFSFSPLSVNVPAEQYFSSRDFPMDQP